MLKGKKAFITGGSRGIGKAIALEMAKNGADVSICYAGNKEAAEETCLKIKEFGVSSNAYCLDVSCFDAVSETIKQVVKDFGTIDILVNNAGIVRDGLMIGLSEKDFDDVSNTNLKGTFNTIKHCYPIFVRKRTGRIINITSVVGIFGNAGQSNYSASKAGIIGLTKSVSKELASRGITCNAIAPGFIETDMTSKLNEDVTANILKNIPMKRFGKPEEVAKLACFLASDGAAYITGEVIKVDGGC